MSMGVYINMEMPKSCRDCRFCNGQANTDYGVCAWCDVDGKARDAYTMQDCPLVPVPPHGRLIDADANLAVMMRVLDTPYTRHGTIDTAMLKACIKMFEEAPTIIPAEPCKEKGE